MQDKNLNRLIKKLEYLEFCNQWYGHLTPTEVLWLLDNGARNASHGYEYIKEHIDSGKAWNFCFYFDASKELLKVINKDNHQKIKGVKSNRIKYE